MASTTTYGDPKPQPSKLDEAVLAAVKATDYCTKHGLYHGQKYKSCTPQERTLIEVTKRLRKDAL